MLYTNLKSESKYQRFSQKEYFPFKHPGFATMSNHAGQHPETVHGSVNVPIHLSSTFAQKDIGQLYSKFDYARCGNPTRDVFEQCMTALEYGDSAIAFSSGIGALTSIILTLKKGEHILVTKDVYGGTQQYIKIYGVQHHGINAEFTDFTDIPDLVSKIRKDTKLIWMESLTNPLLKVIDIQTISKEAKAINPDIKILVDNTFCSPFITSPLLLGADVSLNSVSKFIGGHSDIIMGVLVFKEREYRKKVHFAAYTVGTNPSPFDCYLALRGIKTLELRIRQATKNAYHIAHFLEEQDSVDEVCYPGLKSNKYHELALRQMRGFGGVVSFAIKGGKEQVSKFLKACKVIIMATSLGGTETLASSPKFMNVTACPQNYIRMSVGIEDLDDLIEDIQQALVASQQI